MASMTSPSNGSGAFGASYEKLLRACDSEGCVYLARWLRANRDLARRQYEAMFAPKAPDERSEEA